MREFESFLRTQWLQIGLIALGGFFILTLVFGAGYAVGKWSTTPFNPFPPFARNRTVRSGHGAVGVIVTIQEQTITVQSRNGELETILVGMDTQFDKNFEKISLGDLKVDDRIIVIGSPNTKGQINARLIGLVDPTSPRLPGRNFQTPGGLK